MEWLDSDREFVYHQPWTKWPSECGIAGNRGIEKIASSNCTIEEIMNKFQSV